jgi:O-acetyl-ADP-ribose deacetylase (regulator of RNase III)
MLNAVVEYASEDTGIEKVVFCLYDDETLRIFKTALAQVTSH